MPGPLSAGPGYFRPHVRLFDPGWRGPQAKAGVQDTDTEDWGNDPPGALDRQAHARICFSLLVCACLTGHVSLPLVASQTLEAGIVSCLSAGGTSADMRAGMPASEVTLSPCRQQLHRPVAAAGSRRRWQAAATGSAWRPWTGWPPCTCAAASARQTCCPTRRPSWQRPAQF